jgi:hypothetical protein
MTSRVRMAMLAVLTACSLLLSPDALAAKKKTAKKSKASIELTKPKRTKASRKVVAFNRNDPRVQAIFTAGGVNAAITDAFRPPPPETPPAAPGTNPGG